MKGVITIKDWYWDESIKNMVFEHQNGDKYKGKAHNVIKGKAYGLEIETVYPVNGYISINKWL